MFVKGLNLSKGVYLVKKLAGLEQRGGIEIFQNSFFFENWLKLV